MTNDDFHDLFKELMGKLDAESGLIVAHFSKSEERIQVLGTADVGKAEALGVVLALASRFDFSTREVARKIPQKLSKHEIERAYLACLRRFEAGSREVLGQIEALYLEADQRHRAAELETLEKADARTQSEIFMLIQNLFAGPLLTLDSELARLSETADGQKG